MACTFVPFSISSIIGRKTNVEEERISRKFPENFLIINIARVQTYNYYYWSQFYCKNELLINTMTVIYLYFRAERKFQRGEARCAIL